MFVVGCAFRNEEAALEGAVRCWTMSYVAPARRTGSSGYTTFQIAVVDLDVLASFI